MKYNNVLELIGNTPIIKIDDDITKLKHIEIWAKCELFNPFGSVKDRTAPVLMRMLRVTNNDNWLVCNCCR